MLGLFIGIGYIAIGSLVGGYLYARGLHKIPHDRELESVIPGVFWPIALPILLFVRFGFYVGNRSVKRDQERMATRLRIAQEQEKRRIEIERIEAEVMRELEVDGASLRNEHKVI